MGLDMYLKVERKNNKEKNHLTGACGGMFPFAPSNPENHEEIGYWRKAYDVDRAIMEYFEYYDDDNCVDFELCQSMVEDLLEQSKDIVNELEYDGKTDTWAYEDWKESISIFEKALEELKKGNRVYYYKWY